MFRIPVKTSVRTLFDLAGFVVFFVNSGNVQNSQKLVLEIPPQTDNNGLRWRKHRFPYVESGPFLNTFLFYFSRSITLAFQDTLVGVAFVLLILG